MTAGTAAQTLLGSSTTCLAENKGGHSFFPTFSLFQSPGRKFCLGLAQLNPAALRKEEVSGGSFISNECQTYFLSRHGFETEEAKHFFSTWRHLFVGCSGCLQRPSRTSQQRRGFLGITPDFGLTCSPGQVGACRDPSAITGTEGT